MADGPIRRQSPPQRPQAQREGPSCRAPALDDVNLTNVALQGGPQATVNPGRLLASLSGANPDRDKIPSRRGVVVFGVVGVVVVVVVVVVVLTTL